MKQFFGDLVESCSLIDDPDSLWSEAGCEERDLARLAPAAQTNVGRPDTLGAVRLATAATLRLKAAAASVGTSLDWVDGPQLLMERSQHFSTYAHHPESLHGGSRLLATRDGYVALTISRDSDARSLPALFEGDPAVSDGQKSDGQKSEASWEQIQIAAGRYCSQTLHERMELLSIPGGMVGAHTEFNSTVSILGSNRTPAPSPLVVDLSSMWAGPLCAKLLGSCGATVVKVESTSRPDGARNGPRGFYESLNGGHQSVTCNFDSRAGRQKLYGLVSQADVVISSARPRALDALGINPRVLLLNSRVQCWLAISAYGPAHPMRVGFGDDIAAVAGLVSRRFGFPSFCLDAVADPLTGIVGAAAVLEALQGFNTQDRPQETGGATLMELGMADVALCALMACKATDESFPARQGF